MTGVRPPSKPKKRLRIIQKQLDVSIVNNINTYVESTSVGEEEHVLYGKSTITEVLRGLTFQIPANSFFSNKYKPGHPWLANFQDIKRPLDMKIYKQVKAFIFSSSLRKSALRALAKTLTVSQLASFKKQFQLLGPTKHGSLSMQDFKTVAVRYSTDAMKDARVIEYASSVSSLQYKKFDFEEFCAAAISIHQIEFR